MPSRFPFQVWSFFTTALFRVGMWFIRLSNHSLCHSSNDGWRVGHWSEYTCPLTGDCRDRYAADLKVMLWACAEPHPNHEGAIPLAQYLLLKELVANIWSGGRTVAVVALIDEVMAAEDLVTY